MIGVPPPTPENVEHQSYLFSENAYYIEELYARYLQDANAVSEPWRTCFDAIQDGRPDARAREAAAAAATRRPETSWPAPDKAPSISLSTDALKQAAVLRLINVYRVRGHQQAAIDPLRLRPRPIVPDLDPAYHNLGEDDMATVFYTDARTVGLRYQQSGSLALAASDRLPLRKIIEHARQIYCGSVGSEYMYMTDSEQKRWIQDRLERTLGKPKYAPEARRRTLERVTAAEGLEKYLHTKYVGQKRFSLEGAESLIALLDELVQRAGTQKVKEIVLGMAHRGRLNVLVNILGKSPKELFLEFEGKYALNEQNASGDVKYHQGFSSDIDTPGGPVHLALAFNPSHLEIVDPMVEGSVRARQRRRDDRVGNEVLAVLVHGDAAFAGQGVVMETFNMSQARGFATGGTVHIVINNQIGFTTSNPLDSRSTLYCTEVAKMVQAPIFHVNGDDPEAVVFVTQLALDFRTAFKKDVVIDMVCYRRHGHNEADEPAATQPMMYKKIKAHPMVRKIYAERLVQEGVVSQEQAAKMVSGYRDALDEGQVVARQILTGIHNKYHVDWTPYKDVPWTHPVDTAVPIDGLREIAEQLNRVSEGFELHPRVARILHDRRKMAAGGHPIDWGFAETLAYGTLIRDGYSVRLCGQDSGRGTFFHRHSVLHNQKDGDTDTPLRRLGNGKANFVVIDSLLSEEAVLGFEYGYATAEPSTLVIWEAQFGDFVNGAQVVIDQFISSGDAKWGRCCGLTLFLPHGYEGQGPEHSSARLERFMQLCAEHNIQVCMPTTPAQMFHMLRRQMLRPFRRPLIVMTPKSLLRHKLSTSTLEDLSGGEFQTVIGEIDPSTAKAVQRVILCGGKVYYDLVEERRSRELEKVAIIRIEQLHPFPREQLSAELKRYRQAKEIVWCQEESQNQGAWYQIQHHVRACMLSGQNLHYAGRAASASPAVGHFPLHVEQQTALVNDALTITAVKLKRQA
ncbi:MAG: 2-oxoglutarate dehydrogenase E1 component [Acidiferrobacterales bacterium]